MKKPLKKGSKKQSKKTFKKPLRKISKKPSRKPLEKGRKKLVKKVAKNPAKKPAKKLLKKPLVKASKKPAKKVAIKPVAVTLSAIKSAKTPLWVPSQDKIKNANMTRFIEFVNRRYGKKFRTYDELYQWSIDAIPDFWPAVWDFLDIKASRRWDQVVDDLEKFPGARWFLGSKLNFAENLLRYRDDRLAFIFKGETQKYSTMTYRELYSTVARLAKSLREIGVQPGDRVAGYMPNMMETAIAMLAATSIGAVWSSCATDIGSQAALDRIGQIEPKVLFSADGYFYKAKTFNTLGNAAEVVRAMPSLKKVVIVSFVGRKPDISHIPNAVHYEDFLAKGEPPLEFEQLDFNHPVYIMFSSGTTGKPKCMVQSAGGILMNQLKDLVIHTDLKREDRIFYITTCSWMM